jgi:hypothetical protein
MKIVLSLAKQIGGELHVSPEGNSRGALYDNIRLCRFWTRDSFKPEVRPLPCLRSGGVHAYARNRRNPP